MVCPNLAKLQIALYRNEPFSRVIHNPEIRNRELGESENPWSVKQARNGWPGREVNQTPKAHAINKALYRLEHGRNAEETNGITSAYLRHRPNAKFTD